ncbi:efflux transporter periplasmic adaptor subunit, partial [Vibrio diabolicus]|nr:efflux transporter periplasmic adaptor subunit [Vibrio diabolicus]
MRRKTTLSLLIASSLFVVGCQPSEEGSNQGSDTAPATEVKVLTVEPTR